MTAPNTGFRTPLGRVRGHGSARSGTSHFIAQRVSAVALLFLLPWFALSAALTIDQYTDALAFLRNGFNAVGLVLLLIAGAYHMWLGMQVVIEDYISKNATRIVLSLLNTFVSLALALIGIWAVVIVNIGYGWIA